MNETLGISDEWNNPLQEMIKCLKNQESLQEIEIGKLEQNTLTDSFWNSSDFDRALMLVLEPVIKETDVLHDLIDYISTYYDVDPLFYTYSKTRRSNSRSAFKKCSKIVKDILTADALLMDYEPRDIVAALELPVKENGVTYQLKRPMFPIGNVWMSLIYSKTSPAEEKTSQITETSTDIPPK